MAKKKMEATNDPALVKLELAEKRQQLTLLRRPFKTLYLFILGCVDYIAYLVNSALGSKLFMLIAVPTVAAYLVCKFYNLLPNELPVVDYYISIAVWWIGLGILSSIGLGTGMHSGMLFLFPHIFSVVSASRNCPSMNFDSSCDVWWRDCDMRCHSTSSTTSEADFIQVLLRILPACILWGSGTAVGEVPPYLISRAAALSGKVDEEAEELMKETEGTDAFSKMKKWMIDFVERHGFMGVLVMSAWPNAAFDLVGICCGQLGVPFFKFFIPTLIGKGLIKVSGQAVFFCIWFRNPEVVIHFFSNVVGSMRKSIPQLPITEEMVRETLTEALEKVSKGKVEEEEEMSWTKFVWQSLILAMMGMFLLSTLQHVAQTKQKELDEKTLEKLAKSQ